MPDRITGMPKIRGMRALALAFVLLFAVLPFMAQDASRSLTPGTTLNDVFPPGQTATSYIFDAAAGATATLVAEASAGEALALLLSDAGGNPIAQSQFSAEGEPARIDGALLANGGRYHVLVYSAPDGSGSPESFDISLALTSPAESAPVTAPAIQAPSQVLLAAGMEVELSWRGAADMNLQVREPTGQTLYWDSRGTDVGGSFGFDANGLCQVIVPEPAETAIWQPGFLPTGSYEVLIFYRQACDGSAGSLPFNVNVRVDGVLSGAITGILSPPPPGQDSVYVARFEVDGEGKASVSAGGLDTGLTSLPSGFDIRSNVPSLIARDLPVTGALSNESPFLTYSFSGAAGEVISVGMQAVGPNLDTFLQILDAGGAVVNVNDDAPGTTDSLISNARLLNSGVYTIIASRYGKELGGTEGQFQLTLSGPGSDVPSALTELALPDGDIEVTLLWGTSADLQLLVRDPIGGSVFDDIPFGGSGGILQEAGNVNCVPAASGAPVSYIYWPPGRMRPGTYEVEVWYQNPCTELPAALDFTLVIEALGRTVAVERQFPQPDQRFVTSFTVLPDGSAVRGEGGFIDGGSSNLPFQAEMLSAPEIAAGEQVTGTISPTNTFDLYSFQGVAGETVTISMAAATAVLDANLFLIDPVGNEIAANDDANPALLGTASRTTDAIISGFELPVNGPYTIIATRFATRFGGTIGNYSLTLERG